MKLGTSALPSSEAFRANRTAHLAMLETVPPESLRVGGLAAATLGVFCVWLLRG